MNTKTFNENFTVDRKSRAGVRANPKYAPAAVVEIMTADNEIYDASRTYYFFDEQTREVRQSLGFRRNDDYLCAFGLKVVLISKLRARKRGALLDGQEFLLAEVKRLTEHWNRFGEEAAKEKE